MVLDGCFSRIRKSIVKIYDKKILIFIITQANAFDEVSQFHTLPSVSNSWAADELILAAAIMAVIMALVFIRYLFLKVDIN